MKKLYENKIRVEVSQKDWDRLSEDETLDEISDTIDTIMCEAVDRITELLADLSTEKSVTINVFSD